MRALLAVSLFVLTTVGCRTDVEIADGYRIISNSQLEELGCRLPTDMGDMAPPAPKCAAAKGLPGDVLGNLCVDFSTISDQTLTTTPPQQLPGWSFGKDSMNNDCWEIKGGKLEVVNFSGFKSTCSFTMPAVSAPDYNKYNSFTLSVVQRVSIDESATQRVQVMLGADDPLNRLVTQWTGKGARQQNMMGITKADLPNGGSGYQPLFKFSATTTAGGIYTGWQIESIAVLGNP